MGDISRSAVDRTPMSRGAGDADAGDADGADGADDADDNDGADIDGDATNGLSSRCICGMVPCRRICLPPTLAK